MTSSTVSYVDLVYLIESESSTTLSVLGAKVSLMEVSLSGSKVPVANKVVMTKNATWSNQNGYIKSPK